MWPLAIVAAALPASAGRSLRRWRRAACLLPPRRASARTEAAVLATNAPSSPRSSSAGNGRKLSRCRQKQWRWQKSCRWQKHLGPPLRVAH